MVSSIKHHRAVSLGKWFALFGLSIGAAAFLRAGKVVSEEPAQRMDRDGLDYFCIADAAVAFNQDEGIKFPSGERKMELPLIAKRRCRPALVPVIPGAKPLASGMDFDTGYGGMLSRFSGTKQEAVLAAEKALKQVGWLETPASVRIRSIKKNSTARVFERDGGWLLVVSVDGPSGSDGTKVTSALLTAGQWRRDILESL